MAANEVNDIVMRLLAAADHIHGREKEEILHLVGRLSRAAVCERTAAVDEMQKLRKKIVQQSAELKRITNAAQVPKAGGFPRFTNSRMQATGSDSSPSLDYGSDYGRLSRPKDLSRPTRKTANADVEPLASHSEQQIVAIGACAVPAARLQDTTIQEQPGYGHFNQARFLALQAAPTATSSADGLNGRSSLLEGPAAPVYAVTAANAEPVAPRGKHRKEPAEALDSTAQAADELLSEVGLASMGYAGQKRRASDEDTTGAVIVKRRAMSDPASRAGSDLDAAKLPGAFTQPALQPLLLAAPPHRHNPQVAHDKRDNSKVDDMTPSCTRCFNEKLECDGTAHCGQCVGKKCYYVLCEYKTCCGIGCKKIHRFQYNLAGRKSGQARRNVLGDNVHLDTLVLGKAIRASLKKAIASMGSLGRSLPGAKAPDSAGRPGRLPEASGPSLAGLPPTSTQAFMPIMREAPSAMMSTLPAQAHMSPWNGTFSTAVQPSLAEASRGIKPMQQPPVKTEGTGGESRSLFDVPKAVRDAAPSSGSALMSEPSRPGPLVYTRGVKVESSDG